MKPIALVIPWYGDDIRGGAEQECNYLAHALQDAGADVEVLTTCVKDASADRGTNTIKPGLYTESGIKVRRFKVRKRDESAFIKSNSKIYNNENFTLDDEAVYFKEDINSPDMYEYIRNNKDNYKCFIFIPYMYGVTFNGSTECEEKSVIIPCLHDESYAYMNVLKEKMPKFKGMIFLSKPESDLAHSLYDISNTKTAILGGGLDTEWYADCKPDDFKNKYKIQDDFILFAGRKDAGKKADQLRDFFIKYKIRNPESTLKLVYIGGGDLAIPQEYKKEIFDLGFVSIEDKHDALAAAKFLCNPSYFESFSIVIMESWVAKRPVLVSEHCEVTKNFCLETNGGLYYRNYQEFELCINYLLENSDIADAMGENGFEYVMNNFTHEKIAKKYIVFIKSLFCV